MQVTGQRWDLEERSGEAPPTFLETQQAAKQTARQEILDSPLVKAAQDAFPEAKVDFDNIEDIIRSATA
jgi:DNA polymerase III subunit gamma/tau